MTDGHDGRDGYAVDIVLCVDVTASMRPVIENVKEGALSFHSRLQTVMARRGMPVAQIRVRVIAYRDFGVSHLDAIERTPFLTLPDQADDFGAFVSGLVASGGGDVPESGLEALALALRSEWLPPRSDDDGLRRHFVVLFTDAPAHPLGLHTPTSPDVYPRSLKELHQQWGRPGSGTALMDQDAKRLLIFAPEVEPWGKLADTWDRTMLVPSVAGTGLAEVALDEVVSTIARSA